MNSDIDNVEQWIEKGRIMASDTARRIATARGRKFDTIATHGIYDMQEAIANNQGSIMEPTYLSSAQGFSSSAHMEASLSYQMPGWCYARIANPTTNYLEEVFALLETYGSDIRASCLATSSGMSAIRCATDPFLSVETGRGRANFVTPAKVYGGTFQQFNVRRQGEQNIEVRWVTDPIDIDSWAALVDENTRFLYGEFPTNPSVTLFDIKAVADLAHAHEIPLIVDSSCASPALTRPLLYGADIVVQSATKVIGASGTSIAGFITARENIVSKFGPQEMKANFALWVKLWPFRDNGPCLSPFASSMLINDLRSLRMTVKKMSESALVVAKYLEAHDRVETVQYPGLASYESHDLANTYMTLADTNENMYGYLMSFEVREETLDGSENARTFFDGLEMIFRATDLGRVKTVATLNAISTHQQQGELGRKLADIKPATCRLSIGIEDPEDIIADLEQAFAQIKKT